MRRNRLIQFWVGVLMILAVIALIFLALRVSGLSMTHWPFTPKDYKLNAVFNDIGNLKVRAPVRVAGVQVGQVIKITLNPETFQAHIVMEINPKVNDLPTDTSASISTVGLLGENYVSLSPGYSSKLLGPDGRIGTTYSATNISSLLSTFVNSSSATSKEGSK